jgi:D-alanyl-D-alanine carboxypeptidase
LEYLNAILEKNISAIVKNDSTETISPNIEIKNNLKAPIKKGDIIGTITYNIEGVSYTSNLIANNDVKRSYLFIYILAFVVVGWIIFILLEKIRKNFRKKF